MWRLIQLRIFVYKARNSHVTKKRAYIIFLLNQTKSVVKEVYVPDHMTDNVKFWDAIFYPDLSILFLLHWQFSIPALLMVFDWSESKSAQVYRTLRSIQADLTNFVIWIVFTRALITYYTILFTSPLVTVPNATITIGIAITFTFHSFFFRFL